ncbi:hypothetical protein Bateq7PJ16_0527 [Bacillus subtilis]|nr:hypothetical protein Bateq7PJ16_0527 [Bacillus subtilis]
MVYTKGTDGGVSIEELYYRFTDRIAAWILICVIHVSV